MSECISDRFLYNGVTKQMAVRFLSMAMPYTSKAELVITGFEAGGGEAVVDVWLKDNYYESRFMVGSRLIKENGNYRLKLKLPFISKKDVALNKLHEELIIRIGGFKRHIMLPRQVASLNVVKAKLEGEYLNVLFKGDEDVAKKE